MRHISCCCIIFFLTAYYISLENAYKILIYNPRFAKSHVKFLGAVADILIEAGHEVIQLAPILSQSADTNGSKFAKTITVPPHPKVMRYFGESEKIVSNWNQKQHDISKMFRLSKEMSRIFTINCEHQLKRKEIFDQLKTENFDLAIIELFDMCALGIIELLQIPAHIAVSSSGIWDYLASLIGMPIFPSYVPSTFSWFTDEMTYSQRALNLLLMFISGYFSKRPIEKEQALFQRLYGKDFINFDEKIAQATYFLSNADPLFDFPKPTIHKMKEIGGLTVPKVKPLNEYWSSVMNERKKVVLISFGTVMQSYLMPDKMKKAFLETIDQFPDVTFIWKYEKDEDRIADGHPNLVTRKWLPQTDILAHPNLVLFLTHGGMNSIIETLNRGKPVIVVPCFGDQMRNRILAERAGFAIGLNIPELTENGKLRDAINQMINNENYTQKAEQLSRMIAKRPNPSKEQLIKHVEFAAEFGQIPNFDPYGRKMSFISYFMLDIIIPFILLILLIILGFCYGVIKLYKKLIPKICKIVNGKRNFEEENSVKKKQ